MNGILGKSHNALDDIVKDLFLFHIKIFLENLIKDK